MLNDIIEIIEAQKPKVDAFNNQKVNLTDSFKKQYLETMKDSNDEISIYDDFSIVNTSNGLRIYIPNQWFYLAYLATPLANELMAYKNFIIKNSGLKTQKEFKKFLIDAKNGELNEEVFAKMIESLSPIEVDRIKNFLTNYDSWGGGKDLSRGDYYYSPILNSLNLVNVSSNYIVDISNHLIEHFDIDNTSVNSFFTFQEVKESIKDYEKLFRQWIFDTLETQASIDSNLKYVNTLNRFEEAVNTELNDEDFVPISIWTNPIEFSENFTIDKVMEIATTLEENTSFIPKSGSGSELKTIYKKYLTWIEYLKETEYSDPPYSHDKYNESLIDEHRQYIYFGAPGTGKSFQLNKDSSLFNNNVKRVTFHPNTSYGNFVGVYKPYPQKVEMRNASGSIVRDENESIIFDEKITYNYVPGPLIKQLVDALLHPERPYLLIIEELNRANVAAAFGDLFQLLDRNSNHKSQYPIAINEDLKMYFETVYENLNNREHINFMKQTLSKGLVFPKNFYIWTTMNSADQGVMPMDTAFKRRWEQKYFGIDDAWLKNENKKIFSQYKKIEYKETSQDGDTDTKTISWNVLRRMINDILSSHSNIPEDKLLGPYFISEHILTSNNNNVTESFKTKVLMYLFDDVIKIDRSFLFKGVTRMRYSEVVKTFEERGLELFGITEEKKIEYEAEEYVVSDKE